MEKFEGETKALNKLFNSSLVLKEFPMISKVNVMFIEPWTIPGKDFFIDVDIIFSPNYTIHPEPDLRFKIRETLSDLSQLVFGIGHHRIFIRVRYDDNSK